MYKLKSSKTFYDGIMRSLILTFIVYILSATAYIDAQELSDSDNLIYNCVIKCDTNRLLTKLQANNDSKGIPYFKGLSYALYAKETEAIENLLLASLDSSSVYASSARNNLLTYLFYTGQYGKCYLYYKLFKIDPGKFEDIALYSTYPKSEFIFKEDSYTVPFQLRSKSIAIIKIHVNGAIGRLIVDTGSTQTIISEHFAKKAGIKIIPEKSKILTSTNKETMGGISSIDEMNFCNITIKNLPIKSVPSIFKFPVTARIGRIDGLLGLDVLRQIKYSLDFNNSKFTVEKPTLNKVNNSSKNLFACNEALLNLCTDDNKPFYCFYDSGSNDFNLTKYTKDKTHYYESKLKRHRNFGINGTKLIEKAIQISNFRFKSGRNIINIPKATFTNREYWIMNIPVHAIVGNKAFINGCITVDFLNNRFEYKEQY
jgi:hypothetical protein